MDKEKKSVLEDLPEKAEGNEKADKLPSLGESGKKVGIMQILPISFIILSLVWIYMGLSKFGFYDKIKGGTAAFLPVICAAVMLVASTIALIESFKKAGERPKLDMVCILFFAMCFGIVGLSYVIGLMAAMILYVFIWLKFVEKCSWVSSIIVTVACAAVGYGVFEYLLGVPFAKGMLYNLFFR